MLLSRFPGPSTPFSCPLARRRDRVPSEPAPKTLLAFLRYFVFLRLLGQPYKMFSVLGKPCSLPGSSGTGKGQDVSCPTKTWLDSYFAIINCVPWVNDLTMLCFNFFTGERCLFFFPFFTGHSFLAVHLLTVPFPFECC